MLKWNFLVGVPFKPYTNQRVILKRQYLDENRNAVNKMLTGNEWYKLDAIRAVNQAIGRVIRHRNDYGAILLCDNRFNWNENVDSISPWIREHLKCHQNGPKDTFDGLVGQISDFFSIAKNRVFY